MQSVSVVDGERGERIAFGEAYKIAMELPNCVLSKKVALVRPTVATIGTVAIEIRLEA